MGREVRRVPPNWQHPKRNYCPHQPRCTKDCYQPKFQYAFAKAARDWKESFLKWEAGDRPSYCSKDSWALEFWEYEGDPPKRDYYVDYEGVEPTWFQAYETVSEGTPISPLFSTEEDLIQYLAEKGDFWDSKPWGEKSARAFVKSGSALSMVISDGVLIQSRDVAAFFEEEATKRR